MALLKTIVIIALVYYCIKMLSRIFAPLLLKFATKKAEERFGGQFGQFQKGQKQSSQKKEGEITIDKIPNTKKSNQSVGEYVDFEEID